MPAPADPTNFEACIGVLCDPVVPGNLHSGEFVEASVDLRVAGRGMDLVWARQYRSRAQGEGRLGHGWTHGYDVFIVRRPEGLVVHDGFNVPVLHTDVWPAQGSNQGKYNADSYAMAALYCAFRLGTKRCG